MTDDALPSAQRVHTRTVARLMHIHAAVSRRDGATTVELAHLIERSPRTVKREMDRLRDEFNMPVYFDRSARRWRLRKIGWQPPHIPITEGELLAFFTAERALYITGHTPEAELLRAGLAKLARRLPEVVSVNLATLGDSLSFQQTPHVLVSPAVLDALARASADRRCVHFDYYSPHTGKRSTRTADVYHLHNFAGDWYAISYDHERGEMRDFHAGRITNLRTTDDYFDLPAHWRTDDYLRRGFLMTRGGRLTTVSIVFDEYQARWMKERQAFHPDETREHLPDGSMRLKFPVGTNGLEAVARFCLSYAGHVRVERPAALCKLMIEKLVTALRQHQGGSVDD